MKTIKLQFENLEELRVFEAAFADYQPLGALEAAVILGSDGANVVLVRYQNALDLWRLAGAFHRQKRVGPSSPAN